MFRSFVVLGVALIVASPLMGSLQTGPIPTTLPQPHPAGLQLVTGVFHHPPTTSRCIRRQHRSCYSPIQLQTAYDLQPALNAGFNGRGETIAVVDSFGSPTITRDLAWFDRDFALPAPPSFRIITPSGSIPSYSPKGVDRVGWAVETTMDVEYAHAMAPEASILLVETPVDETIGVTGFPQIIHAENYVINHHLANVITQSFGAAEYTFPNRQSIKQLRSAYFNARNHDVTVLASSGDQGPTSVKQVSGSELFKRRTVIWPASDPLVTGVGGTTIRLDATGNRTGVDTAWNDCPSGGCVSAGGGGLSVVFPRPAFQNSVRTIVGATRGVPDVAMVADPRDGALVRTSFAGLSVGYHIVGGTSLASPLLAGIVADADQANGTPLGFLNPRLYALKSGSASLPDITIGDTTVTFHASGGQPVTVKGWPAATGYDLATGLGTVDGSRLIAALTGRSLF
jgi:subtilase family serine protease